jgi:hypothetical protein
MRSLRPDAEFPAAPPMAGPAAWLPVLTRRAFLGCAWLLAGGAAALTLAGCARGAPPAPDRPGASFFDDGTGFAA